MFIFLKKVNFFITYSSGLSLEEENIIKNIRNLFRLKEN